MRITIQFVLLLEFLMGKKADWGVGVGVGVSESIWSLPYIFTQREII